MPAHRKFPEPPSTFTDWSHQARLTREKGGEWRKLPRTYERTVAVRIRQGRIAAFREPGAWDAKYLPSKDQPGRCLVWVRWVPPEERDSVNP